MGDVYIAYATPQVSEALLLATGLEAAGFGTIIVDVDCPFGTPYAAWVHETIERVRVVIALLPPTPVERVMCELRLAETLGKPRIVVGTPRPYRVRAEHHLADGDGTDELARLLRAHGVPQAVPDPRRIGRLRAYGVGSRVPIPDRLGGPAPSALARILAAVARAAGGRTVSSARPVGHSPGAG